METQIQSLERKLVQLEKKLQLLYQTCQKQQSKMARIDEQLRNANSKIQTLSRGK